jgi:hypothetical protein
MDEKKRIYESEIMGLPPLRLVIGDIPSPDPERRKRPNQPNPKTDFLNRKGTVKRIITHLEKD